MIHWLQCAIVCWIGVSFVLSFPSLSCPESSSSRWCEMHSNQQTWPPMVPSSPAADAWTIGKFATPTKQGLQGSDGICGQDVGGTQWYFQAPKKLLASSWLPYNGRIVWQLGIPIWETQAAANSKDDILIRCLENTKRPPNWTEIVGLGAYNNSISMQRGNIFNSLSSVFAMDLNENNFVFKETRNKVSPSFFRRCLSRATHLGINGGITKQGEITCLQYVWIISEGPMRASVAWPQMRQDSYPDKVTCANKSNTNSGANERPAVSPWLQSDAIGDFVTILNSNLVLAKDMVNLTFATPSPLCWDAQLLVRLSNPPTFLRKIEVFDQGGRLLGGIFDSQHSDPTIEDTLWVPASSIAPSVTGFVTFILKSSTIYLKPNTPGVRGDVDFTVQTADLRIKRTPCVSRISKISVTNLPVTGRLSLPPMSPHLTCQTDVQPATIGVRIYRQVIENRQVGGVTARSWDAQNFSSVALTLGSYTQNVSVRTVTMNSGDTTQQEYNSNSKSNYFVLVAGFVTTSLSGLYAFCVQGGRELQNICQLPVSVAWSPSDVAVSTVEFVLSAAIRPSCMQSSFLNAITPGAPLKMFQKGMVDFDDSFLKIPIPNVPPVGAHLFAQFHVEMSVTSGTIQVVCGNPEQPMSLGFLLGSQLTLPMQWQLPLLYPLFSTFSFPLVSERREGLLRLDVTVTRSIQNRCFSSAEGSASLMLRFDSTKNDASVAAALPNNIGERYSGSYNDAMIGGISIFWMDPSPYFTANVDSNPLEYSAKLISLSTNQW